MQSISPSHNQVNNSEGAPHGREEYGARSENTARGLSTCHISTLSNVTLWAGGSLMRCQRNNMQTESKNETHKRGRITGFSNKSRRRMMQKLAKTDREIRPVFVTMTFPDEFYEYRKDMGQVKKILKRLQMRFDRSFPDAGIVWRIEGKPRKSGLHVGEWFPHIHLLVWGVNCDKLRGWIQINWWETCGKLSLDHLTAGTRVENLRSVSGVFFYISKYVSKKETFPEDTKKLGRIWGVWNEKNLPWVKAICIQLDEKEAVLLLRYMRKFARLKGHDYKSLTIFCNADFWYYRLTDIIHPSDYG